MNKIGQSMEISFSYGRALQQAALKTWNGQDKSVLKAHLIIVL